MGRGLRSAVVRFTHIGESVDEHNPHRRDIATKTAHAAIRTTVVGTYPVPDWLAALPSQQSLIDATRVVFKTQEMAGIDVVADGELYRFDVNHPDTNGMIEYFIRPMSGIRSAVTRADIAEFAKQEGMGFRAEPAGVVEGPVGEGTLNLPRDYRRARALTRHAMKFTLTGPHMLCKTLMDQHYKQPAGAGDGDRAGAGAAGGGDRPEVLQVDEANIPGHPDEGDWAADAINLVLDAATRAKEKGVHMCFGNYGGQSIQNGDVGEADRLPEPAALRPRRPGVRLPRLRRAGPLQGPARPAHRPGPGRDRHQGEHGRNAARKSRGGSRAAAKIVGAGRIKWVHPDCGFWMNKRSIADRKMEALVKGRDLFLATRGLLPSSL